MLQPSPTFLQPYFINIEWLFLRPPKWPSTSLVDDSLIWQTQNPWSLIIVARLFLAFLKINCTRLVSAFSSLGFKSRMGDLQRLWLDQHENSWALHCLFQYGLLKPKAIWISRCLPYRQQRTRYCGLYKSAVVDMNSFLFSSLYCLSWNAYP